MAVIGKARSEMALPFLLKTSSVLVNSKFCRLIQYFKCKSLDFFHWKQLPIERYPKDSVRMARRYVYTIVVTDYDIGET